MKNSQEIADIMKGTANHHRVDVLFMLEKEPELSVDSIAEKLCANYKTIAVHISRLQKSGLVNKRYKASYVQHTLTPRGKQILKFLRILE